MINFGIITAIVVVVFGLFGVLVWFLNQKQKYRFVFRVWAKDLTSSHLVKGRITIDKNNKNKRSFTFKNNPSVLVMRDPAHWVNGKPERWVVSDESGEYQYLNPVKSTFKRDSAEVTSGKPIDDTLYMKTRLNPVNKMLSLEQMRNNQERYNPINNAMAGVIFGIIVFGVMLAIGIIYGMGTLVKHSQTLNDNIHTMKDTQSSSAAFMIEFAEIMKESTLNLGYIYGQLQGEGVNITRSVDGFRP